MIAICDVMKDYTGKAGFAGAAELVDAVDADGVVETRITYALVMIQFTRRTCTHRYTYL